VLGEMLLQWSKTFIGKNNRNKEIVFQTVTVVRVNLEEIYLLS